VKDTTEMDQHLLPEPSWPARNVFTLSHPAFLAGMQQGAELFQQEHGQKTFLKDLALLEFYQDHLTPFALDPIKNAGVLLGWVRAFLASGLLMECYTGNLDVLAGYYIAAHDWQIWRKDDLLTDVEFANLLATELSPGTLATMHAAESWYTEAYQIGYAFGLVRALLISPDVQIEERAAAQ